MQGLLDSLEVPTPPPLDSGPLWMRIALESPWYGAVILAILALIAYVVFNRRGKFTQGLLAAAGLIAVAGGLVLLAAMIETPRERMRATAAELIESVATADSAQLEGLLAKDARLVYFLAPQGLDKAEIVGLVQAKFTTEYRIKEWSILENQATMDGPEVGRVQIKVRVVAADWSVPNVSWWTINLRRDAQTRVFTITGITPIAIAGVREAN